DFDVLRRERFDRLEIKSSVGEIERHAVLHQLQSPTVEGALDARAADGESRFLGPETGLHKNAGGVVERVFQRRGAAAPVVFRVDHRDPAGSVAERFPDLLYRGDSEGTGLWQDIIDDEGGD